MLVIWFVVPMLDKVLMYGLVTGWCNCGRMPRNGADYRTARFRGPRSSTIDERYFYRTWLDRIRAGLGTEEEFYAEQGKEWSEEQRQRVLEVKNLRCLCNELGVPYEKVRESMPGVVTSGALAQEPVPDDEGGAKSGQAGKEGCSVDATPHCC